MNNDDIHKGLEKQEIRDFLAKQLAESGKNGGMLPSEHIKKDIEKLQVILKASEIREAVLQLIKVCGWDWYDISDYVKYNPETYFEFIGTKEEYKKIFGELP